MLLRSITKHVGEQNWVAVAIDFVIVVVGVFIGIQVAKMSAIQDYMLQKTDPAAANAALEKCGGDELAYYDSAGKFDEFAKINGV